MNAMIKACYGGYTNVFCIDCGAKITLFYDSKLNETGLEKCPVCNGEYHAEMSNNTFGKAVDYLKEVKNENQL